MGLLDDAIREHLDLKRRHGADASEVERAEQEALGPVRREPEDVAVDDGTAVASDLELEEDLAYADGETEWSDTLEGGAEPDQPAAPPEPDALANAPGEPQPSQHAEPPGESVPEPGGSEPFDHGHETAEYDVEGALEHEQAKDGDDVLEETPEFLQDTPDHDRLWFEQKPPRDFNFDG